MDAEPARPTPEAGKLVQVRGRPALVDSVSTHKTPAGGTVHLAQVEYVDEHAYPERDAILWELEPELKVRKTEGWPNLRAKAPDAPEQYRAYLDAIRWSSLASMEGFGLGDDTVPLVSPWSAAVQVEDYQLVPLLKALAMPRVSLLLADDVGLGKTIQAGLITTEMMIRRGIRRILVVAPASLQYQWQQELHDKFHLDFTVMDADEVRRTKLDHGSDSNPWGIHSRVITSMDFLKQDLVLEEFRTNAARMADELGDGRYPWDLLIVDEAHNVAPRRIGDDSQRTKMMRELTFLFEHRLFLSATPHNGYPESFTGLLELLDPYRFIQRQEMTKDDLRHRDLVMVRRLKRQINEASSVPRFPERELLGLNVTYTPKEKAVWAALRTYRDEAVKRLGETGRKSNLGQFLFSLLVKRMLSSPYAFARTWWSHVAGGLDASEVEAEKSIRRAEEETGDDSEQAERERLAASQTGTWLFREQPTLRNPADKVSQALRDLGWDEKTTSKGAAAGIDIPDGKWATVIEQIRDPWPLYDAPKFPPLIGSPKKVGEDRLLLFTEYRDTQQLILARLHAAGYGENVFRPLFGGMPTAARDEVKELFNDDKSMLRILVATDAASEGLNLQKRCSRVAHYDIPWNPMRLEQRNGRVDRHGQAAEVVQVFHYNSSEDEDDAFLARLIKKVNQAREDLGSVEAVIDAEVSSRLVMGRRQSKLENWEAEFDTATKTPRELLMDPPQEAEFMRAKQRFEAASERYGLSKEGVSNLARQFLTRHHQCSLVETKNGLEIKGPKGKVRKLLDRHLADKAGNYPTLVFDPEEYLDTVAMGRRVYRPRHGTRLLRIGHPIVQAALGHYRRALWNPMDGDLSRWTIQSTKGSEAYVQFDVLITVRNKLQEVANSWVETHTFHVLPKGLAAVAQTRPTGTGPLRASEAEAWQQRLGQAVALAEPQLAQLVKSIEDDQRRIWTQRLTDGRKKAEVDLVKEFDRQIRDLKQRGVDERRQELERALAKAKDDHAKQTLVPEINEMRKRRVDELKEQLKPEHLNVWARNQETQVGRLEKEKERFVTHVLPKRFTLGAGVEVVPVGIRAFVPEVKR